MKFRDQLRKELMFVIPNDLIDLLPAGVQFISSKAILNLKEELFPYKNEIGQAVMELLPKITGVWIRTGTISGQFRTPEGLEHICGDSETEIIHTENKIRYKFDFTKIMFAKGNITERRYLPELIRPGEIVVDMFAGIGYFSLGIAKYAKPKQIYAIELNPVSYFYLKENVRLNNLSEKITPLQGDCENETLKLTEQGIKADRIIMGVFPAPYQYLEAAIRVIQPKKLLIQTNVDTFIENTVNKPHFDVYSSLDKISNTVLHFEGVIVGRDFTQFYRDIQNVIVPSGYDSSILATRFVKSFGPKMYHIVLDLAVGIRT